jgi:hypothetical protein
MAARSQQHPTNHPRTGNLLLLFHLLSKDEVPQLFDKYVANGGSLAYLPWVVRGGKKSIYVDSAATAAKVKVHSIIYRFPGSVFVCWA